MALLTVQNVVFGGLNYTSAAAATADEFVNDGKDTFLVFLNGNASSRTLTIAANDAVKPGHGTIATPDTVVTIPGSGTNGGRCIVGPFPAGRFNDNDGHVNYTLDDASDMTVSVLKLTPYA